jgi:hypothetical protein
MAMLGALGGMLGGAGGGLSGIFGLFGSFMQAAAAKQQADAEAEAAEYNARVNDQKAIQEKQAAEARSEDFTRRENTKKASAIADLGGSGIQLAGTPLMLLSDIEQEIVLGAEREGNIGATRATGYQNTATLDRMKAKNARKAGSLAAGSAIIGGMSSFF